MSSPTIDLTAQQAAALEARILAETRPRYARGLLLAVPLFAATLLATTYAGYVMATSPLLDLWSLAALQRALADPSVLLAGLPFSLALMSILLAHEMGHHLACSWHGLDASPPYFLPGPTLVGTFGAFIRIRSPIPSRRILFDVGAAGPLAGFALACAYLVLGTWTVDPARLAGSVPAFGLPAVMRAVLELAHGPLPDQVFLPASPTLMAAWVGFFLTALNLLPVGQLDGGHVLHAAIGRHARPVGLAVFGGVVALLFTTGWPGWALWAVLLLFLGLKHPHVPDPRPLTRGRLLLVLVCLVVLGVCFVPDPISLS